MTEEQKRKMEEFYNDCSLGINLSKRCRESASNKMLVWEEAVKILGYRFEFKKTDELYGTKYSTYRLVKIEEN